MTLIDSSPSESASAGTKSSRGDRPSRRFQASKFLGRYGLVLFLLFEIILFSILKPNVFLTTTMVTTTLSQQTVIMCLALAVIPIVVAGEFDLSIGYVLGLCTVVLAAVGENFGWTGVLVILATVVVGAAIGLLNGVLVGPNRIPSMIATLGVGLAVGGLTVGVSGGRTLTAGIPDLVFDLTTTKILGLHSSVWIVGALAVILYLILAHTPTGRRMYAVGGSEEVARLAGIRTTRIKVLAFVAAGAMVALAATLSLGTAGGANPSFGPGLLLPAYAAVFLGSTTIRPGFFNVWGTVVATLVLAIGFTGLNLVGVPPWTQPIFNGSALVLGVLISRREMRRAAGR